MRLNELCLLLAACLLGSTTGVASAAVPDGLSGFSLVKRQDDVTADGEVEPYNTDKLRECRPAKDLYIDKDTVEWNEVNKDETELKVTVTTKKGEKDIPVPEDAKQGIRFVTDHVLELQLVQAAFDKKNREYNDDAKKISDGAWKTAKEAVEGGSRDNCKKVAEKITVLDNLLGIAESINIGKQVIYTKVVNDKTNTDLKEKWNKYLKAWKKYLDDYKSKVETVANSTAKALGDLSGEDAVSKYAATFLTDKYKVGQDYVQNQLEKLDGEEQTTETPLEATPKCDEGISHSVNDLNPIIDALKGQGNGANNDNCCTLDMGMCQQLEFNGEIGLNMCGPGEGPGQCTGCANVANALTSLVNTCAKDGRVGGKVELLDGVTLEMGLIRPSRPGRTVRLRL
ncbi:MAG: hypothetical protein Q9226_001110 [Calogaya cf. arnoldii]